ncbi:hypothetical protein NP603_13905 [Methylomonas sp. SURF-1]|uniref:Uncharacterized protein n=1 Tax=Methylomonas aurea TaxID=2952224 RepID=A0ABT1UIZ8_9GAMM|nr:hypothetical protein [Methylomonas sp. SURF-1]MCQ8182212.1 hypothetical protein [Methylomonas sp. SURF-1]
MKAYLIIEDEPSVPSGVRVIVMHQPTTAETESGLDTQASLPGMMVQEAYDHLREITHAAAGLAADIQRRQQARKEQAPCLH